MDSGAEVAVGGCQTEAHDVRLRPDRADRSRQGLHRRVAQGRAARAPRRVGDAGDRGPAGRAPSRDGAGRSGAAGRLLPVPRLRPLHRDLPVGRRPDQDRRGRAAADVRGRGRAGGAERPVRGADGHPVHLDRARHPGRGVRRGHRGRPGGRRARPRHRAALDLRHPRRAGAGGRRRHAADRPRPRPVEPGRIRARWPRDRRTAAAVQAVLRRGPGRRPAQRPARRRDHRTGDDLGRHPRARRRADRSRHLRRPGSRAARVPGRSTRSRSRSARPPTSPPAR